jgi:hypothetical protein
LKTTATITFFLFLSVLFSRYGWSQTAPKYSNEFLNIGVGARSFGMSHSTVASVRGVTATYWNPAALTQLKYPVNLGLMHSEYFAGLSQYDYGTVALKPDEKSSLAISFIRFGVDNIPNTLELIDGDGNIRFDRIKSFSVADYAVWFSYARKLPLQGLSIGGNAKIIRRMGGDFARAWGFGIDLAAHYQWEKWQFGVMARDITTTVNSWTYYTDELSEVFELTGNMIPESSTEVTLPKLIMGASHDFRLTEKFGVLAEVNLDLTTDGKRNVLLKGDPFSIDPHAGVEFRYMQFIFLRMGIGNIQKEVESGSHLTLQPNMGLGIAYKRLTVDYALTDLGNISAAGYSHVFSLTFSLEPKPVKPN